MAWLGMPRAAQAAPAAVPGGPIVVSGVTIGFREAGETFVEVATSRHASYRLLQLKNPQRLVVDVEAAHKATPQSSYKSQSPLLKRVRVGQFRAKDPAVVRVVADLQDDPGFDVHDTPSGFRIDLKQRTPEQAEVVQAVKPTQPPPPTQQPPPPATQQTPPPAAGTPRPTVPPPSMQVSSLPFYRRSPLKSLSQNEKLLDSLGLRLALNFSYRKGGPDEAPWKTKGAPAVVADRLFIKPGVTGSYRTIELAIIPSPQGGYELIVYGQQVEPTAQGPNPDFPAIQQLVNEEVVRMEQAPPAADLLTLNYETYYLSYVVADRAIALLKTLGYTTVEYNGQAGESVFQTVYNPLKLGTGRPPIIVKLLDSTKTSLMDSIPSAPGAPGQPMAPQAGQPGVGGGATVSGVPPLGGTYLHQMTSGDTQERLLILYDRNDPESLQSLINLLETTVDVPSRQIMIEALVVELNSTGIRNLGVTFETVQSSVDIASAGTSTAQSTLGAPLSIFTFTKGAPSVATFNAQLQALIQKNEAEILSNPSVLVLDDRQARIQIGQQVPVSKQLVTGTGLTNTSVDYFPVGIVLNLRPRINEDGSEVTMQTETIVSSVKGNVSVGGTLVAPLVDNRQVQSIVRVSDNTPFIIGGLISTDNETKISGIPFLSQIPVLGNLFRSSTVTKVKQEVIIVVTPHVVPLEDKYFSYVIPKDSDQFDRFNYRLFRNAYRVRGNDLFNLEFVYESNVYRNLVSRVSAASAAEPQLRTEEPFASVLKGGAPGEDILVRRMLWEIINHTNYGRFVNPDRIIFFESNPSAPGGAGFQLAFLNQALKKVKHERSGLALTFDAQPQGTEERPLVPPKAVQGYPNVTRETYPETLINGNDRNPDGTPRHWTVLLSKEYSGIRVSPFELLRDVLVLKRLLELNKDMPLTLKEFHIGRQIVFPSQEELQRGNQFIDREVAKLFYEVYNYYPAFEQEFNRGARQINARLEKTPQR